jgi:hypothetical protein
MPCYTVQTASVNLNNADHDLLAKALEKLGYTVVRTGKNFVFRKGAVSGSYQNNKINMQATGGAKMDTDEIKRAYSEQVIHHMAEKYAEEGYEMTRDGEEYVWTQNPGYGAVYA